MAARRGCWIERQGQNTTDTNGAPILLAVGLLRDQRGRVQRAIGIGDGPTALLTDAQVDELIGLLEQSAKDKERAEGGR
ncbi:hypothetical protein SD37_11850 [Amycolatopsis orientalis]|uniref:Uncharacterized protein n=1 Tax=Amycolatopsis orientalis TaxID=31958 RepID=A0A193BVM2_AMYOR|nr:hypothetical protein [Amycolatopsis orientalis]ANN16272.1 hypothetical protein SD37_11850 [Amycolatopsis orientalis]